MLNTVKILLYQTSMVDSEMHKFYEHLEEHKASIQYTLRVPKFNVDWDLQQYFLICWREDCMMLQVFSVSNYDIILALKFLN